MTRSVTAAKPLRKPATVMDTIERCAPYSIHTILFTTSSHSVIGESVFSTCETSMRYICGYSASPVTTPLRTDSLSMR